MTVRMRHTRAHSANRRSHHSLDQKVTLACKECGKPKLPHMLCENCGKYKERVAKDVYTKLAKKEKKLKEKEKAAEGK